MTALAPPLIALTLAALPSTVPHVPPLVVLLKVVTPPIHTLGVPVITAGTVSTVTVRIAIQPVGAIYVTTAVPAVMPVTLTPLPIAIGTRLTALARLLHVPPAAVLLSVIEFA